MNIKKYILFLIMLSIFVFLSSCARHDKISEKTAVGEKEKTISEKQKKKAAEQMEKGYDLPVKEKERKKAVEDCKNRMQLIFDIYKNADKGGVSNVVISDETILSMQDKLKEIKDPVITEVKYSDMQNNEKVEDFLEKCAKGKRASVVIYELRFDGGMGRKKYSFDGKEMYVLNTIAVWNEEDNPVISDVSYSRIEKWKYTKKGWFCYNCCVPKTPEVSEVINGSCLIRVKPMSAEQREMSEKCVKELGYQGNNLLCSNWDQTHMQDLDYNGIYESLYQMKYKERFNSEKYQDGIPQKEFESLIMEYLPVTAKQIRDYAAFDEKKKKYKWVELGCVNRVSSYFSTSLPEVTDIKKEADGTVILTVEAVCDMVLSEDDVITHELTVKFEKDGSFKYLGNKILNDGIQQIPQYQYRVIDK